MLHGGDKNFPAWWCQLMSVTSLPVEKVWEPLHYGVLWFRRQAFLGILEVVVWKKRAFVTHTIQISACSFSWPDLMPDKKICEATLYREIQSLGQIAQKPALEWPETYHQMHFYSSQATSSNCTNTNFVQDPTRHLPTFHFFHQSIHKFAFFVNH